MSILLDASLYRSKYNLLLKARAFLGDIEFSNLLLNWRDSSTAWISRSVATVGTFIRGRDDSVFFGSVVSRSGSDNFRSDFFFFKLFSFLLKFKTIPSESLSLETSSMWRVTSFSLLSLSNIVSPLGSFIWNFRFHIINCYQKLTFYPLKGPYFNVSPISITFDKSCDKKMEDFTWKRLKQVCNLWKLPSKALELPWLNTCVRKKTKHFFHDVLAC